MVTKKECVTQTKRGNVIIKGVYCIYISIGYQIASDLNNRQKERKDFRSCCYYGAFTLDVKSVLIENVGGILGGTQH
jgi:hypothetical protein